MKKRLSLKVRTKERVVLSSEKTQAPKLQKP
jgi:hypothetical protein